jgi:hypothetical protein
MVRAKKNLPVKTTPMAAGADYGEVQTNEGLIKDIGMPDMSEPTLGATAPTEQMATANPLEAAKNFQNTVTPLTEKGSFIRSQPQGFVIDEKTRAAAFLSDLAEHVADPAVRMAADDLKDHLRNGQF